MRKSAIFLLLMLFLPSLLPSLAAQSTARGRITGVNGGVVTLDINASDLRFNQIPETGGILSITIGTTAREAYLLPYELTQATPDLLTALRRTGFDAGADTGALVLIVSRNVSQLQHLDLSRNALTTFGAAVGDEVRVDSVAPPPVPIEQRIETTVSALNPNTGDILLSLPTADVLTLGLLPDVGGTVTINGQTRSFLFIRQEDYLFSDPADVYLYPALADNTLTLAPYAPNRNTQNLAAEWGATPDMPVTLTFMGFTYGDTFAGRITDSFPVENRLTTSIPAGYLSEIGLAPGRYAILILNGITRAAMVMDATMFADSQSPVGLGSNYIILIEGETLSLLYTVPDGRNIAEIFAAETGNPVRLRPAKALDALIRAEVVVKVITEIAPEGYLYTDITPLEISFLEVLIGEYVNVQINGITYRARVVDDSGQVFEDDILVYPSQGRILITQSIGNNITAEARFQASVGDPVVIERAPN